VEDIMTRKTGWEEPSTGPDWIDVEMLMRAIGSIHDGEIAIVISPDGIGSSGGVAVAASALFHVVPGADLPLNVLVEKKWPCTTHKTLASHAFALLHELDREIGKSYKSKPLFD
jgi:hypothetical protein